MTKSASHEFSFGIIPLKQEGDSWKVLLILHRKGQHWAFPKGHGEKGETPLESAKRELKEETGLDVVRLLQEKPFVEQYQFYRKGDLVVKEVAYFPSIVEGELFLQEEEIRDARWLSLAEALEKLTFEEAKGVCGRVIEMVSR